MGGVDPANGGSVFFSEFGKECVQVNNAATQVTTKDVAFAGTEEWKVQGKAGSCLNKRDCCDKAVPSDTTRSLRRSLAAVSATPAWLNNLLKKMGVITRAVF